jgi:hypothetical protein
MSDNDHLIEENTVLNSFEKAYNSYASKNENYENVNIKEFQMEENEESEENFDENLNIKVVSSEEFNKDLIIEEEEEKIENSKKRKREENNHSGSYNISENDPIAPPPPLPAEILKNEDLANLLLSWYYSGYYTGYYQGKNQK